MCYYCYLCVFIQKWVIKGRSHVSHLFSLVWPRESSPHWAARWHMSCSFTACPLHCPRGLLATRRGNTWSLLCFKWLPLTLHSPLGAVRLSHFVSCFPTEARSREASVRSVLRETLETRHSSPLNPDWRDHSTQGDHLSAPTSAAGFTWKRQRQVQACQCSAVDAARVAPVLAARVV